MADYFKQKARDPHGLRNKLVELHEKQVGAETIVTAAPNYTPSKSNTLNLTFTEPAPYQAEATKGGLHHLINALQQSSPKAAS